MAQRLAWLITVQICLIVLMNCTSGVINEDPMTVPEQIQTMIEAGEFTAATETIEQYLQQEILAKTERRALLFELERMDRIRKDFGASRTDIETYIRKYFPAVTKADILRWESERALEVRTIDGQKVYFDQAARNLFRIDPELKVLWTNLHPDDQITAGSGAKLDLDAHNLRVIQAAAQAQTRYVEPKRIRIRYSIEVNANAVPAGETIRCWIPYPRQIKGRQEQLQLIRSQPEEHILAPEKMLQRTIYLEQPAVANQTTLFSVEYELTSHGVHQGISVDSVTALNSTTNLDAFLQEEAPHIVFSPELRELSERIVGSEQNPYRKAQLLFAWIDENTPWASAREYSTINCIPEYALKNGHGDCGIQTLLFITLCRLNGIPARWQSGWELQPPHDSMHDWGMIYFEPYGWVPMDITYGLRKSADPELKWFYLSGMDSYRIIFNDGYGAAFFPEKTHFRSETVDSQRGEVEWSGGNLYFDQWHWDFKWELLD